MTEPIRYQHGLIEAVVSQITGESNKLQGTLEDLRRKLDPLVAGWEGTSAAAYKEHQRAWDEAAAGLQSVLTRVSAAARQGNEGMQAADRAASRAW